MSMLGTPSAVVIVHVTSQDSISVATYATDASKMVDCRRRTSISSWTSCKGKALKPAGLAWTPLTLSMLRWAQ